MRAAPRRAAPIPWAAALAAAILLTGCSRPADGGPRDEAQVATDPSYQRYLRAGNDGDFGAARAAAVDLARRFPSNGSAWNCVGWASERIGLAGDAERAYRKAVEVNPRHAKAWANLGLMLAKRGDYDGEIRCYRRSLALRPNHAATWQNLAAAARQANRPDESREALIQVGRLAPAGKARPHPSPPPTFPAPAPQAASPGPPAQAAAAPPAPLPPPAPPVSRREETPAPPPPAEVRPPVPPPPKPSGSIEDYRLALRDQPQNAGLWNELGLAQAGSGSLEESLESFRRSVRFAASQTAPRWNLTRAALLLAEKDFKEGRAAQGLARFREAVQACPEPAALRVALVRFGLALDNLPAAREDAAGMSREGADAGGAWLALGLALAGRAQDRDALDALQAATQCLPNQPAGWHALGVVEARLGRLEEAAAALSRAAKLDPSSGWVPYHQGLVEARRKDFRKAAAFLRSAARRVPAAEVLEAALAAEEKAGEGAEVRAICRDALAKDPSNAAAWRALAQASEGAGDFAAAAEAWGRAAGLLPGDAEVLNRLGVALARAGRTADARAAFAKGLELAPSDPALLGNLALALRRHGQVGESEQVLSRLRKVDAARAAEIAAWWKASERRKAR
jgi:tetratricopeptide (TPR) repeat protein